MSGARRPWQAWYERWERQQEAYLPNRERRFTALLDVLAASLPARFRALDLGCGPGSLSARLLDRFPRARVVAVDHDPVVRRIGEGALGDRRGRLTWIDADLGVPGWDAALPRGRYDAAVSTTALHWLEPPRLRRLYRDLARRLRRGGIVLNGDRLPYGRDAPALARLAEKVRAVRRKRVSRWTGHGPWEAFWRAAERDPALRSAFAARVGEAGQHPHHENLALSVHVRALRRAGFRPVEVVWRSFDDGILYARR